MTLTLNIPEAPLMRAESYALANGKNLEELLLGLLEDSLADLPPPPMMNRETRQVYGHQRMQILAVEQGLEWEKLSDVEREQFLVNLLEGSHDSSGL